MLNIDSVSMSGHYMLHHIQFIHLYTQYIYHKFQKDLSYFSTTSIVSPLNYIFQGQELSNGSIQKHKQRRACIEVRISSIIRTDTLLRFYKLHDPNA
jgi:hypothetical protein